MALKMTWANPNAVSATVRIYRGDAPLDPANLPAPLATIPSGTNEYIDATAAAGQTYYYIFGSKTDNDEVLTPNQKFIVTDNKGVGPSILLYGDNNLGYYGTVAAEDFVNSSVIAASGVTNIMGTTVVIPVWHKFIRNGKILYLPDQSFHGGITYRDIYQAGFMFGIDANGPANANLTGLTLTNQLRTFDFKGQKYLTRTLRGWNDGAINALDTQAVVTVLSHDTQVNSQDNEFNDLIYALDRFVPLKQRTENWGNYLPDLWLGAPLSSYDSASITNWNTRYRQMVQERYAGGNVMTRGQRETTYGQNQGNPHSRIHLAAMNVVAVTQLLLWMPVVEWIEPSVTVTL